MIHQMHVLCFQYKLHDLPFIQSDFYIKSIKSVVHFYGY
eukprot:jgi/Antlo1/1423/1390